MTASDRQRVGKSGERLARRHLESIGYSVLAVNYRTGLGEIDLVGEKDGILVFIEVRTRTGSAYGTPEESVTRRKQSHIVDVANEYMQSNGSEGRDWRIDVVAIELGRGGELKRIDVLENAVEL